MPWLKKYHLEEKKVKSKGTNSLISAMYSLLENRMPACYFK